MNSGMVKKPLKLVLDTNILVSALIYGGKPEQVYNLILEKQITAITSTILFSELFEVLIKKFNFDPRRVKQLERIIKKHFKVVYPNETINAVKDDDDNRVLEAAKEGKCEYIITGDKELLKIRKYKHIKIVTAEEFLNEISSNLTS